VYPTKKIVCDTHLATRTVGAYETINLASEFLSLGDIYISSQKRAGSDHIVCFGALYRESYIKDAFVGFNSYNLFPTIHADGPCSLHVDLGQGGFVFIEANVKKWGLASKCRHPRGPTSLWRQHFARSRCGCLPSFSRSVCSVGCGYNQDRPACVFAVGLLYLP
jgi:hypothetical protein